MCHVTAEQSRLNAWPWHLPRWSPCSASREACDGRCHLGARMDAYFTDAWHLLRTCIATLQQGGCYQTWCCFIGVIVRLTANCEIFCQNRVEFFGGDLLERSQHGMNLVARIRRGVNA